jgi:predicted chitinase
MKLEQAKSQILPGVVTPSKKQAPAKALPLQAKAATPTQLQRARNKLEQDRSQIQRQAEEANIQRIAGAASQAQARIQRLQDQALALEQQVRVQHLANTQTRQQSFFSSFIKSPVQRKSQQQVKTSSVQTAQARDQYQAAIQPEILQRLVDDSLSLQLQTARATQPQNALNARAEWFNTELPVLRAQHNHPDTPFLDDANVFKPTDQQAFTLGKTYGIQRLASGLTPTDAASAILNIQRKQDRDIALRGLLTGVNPRQSDYASIQRLVAQGEADFELQRQALLEDPAIQSQVLQLAKDEAHPTSPNSGISDKIKTKLGGGNPLPENVRQQLETGLNTDLSNVRVHTDSEADFLSKSVQAKAFTTGNDIFFSSGAFDPNTKSGYELIAHETTHTVQQASGQVQPGIDTDLSLETAAQSKGAELASGFNPNFKYKNLENQAQPNSPLIASQPPAHRSKLQAMQRSSLLQHQPLQREPQAASPVVAPTVSQTLDETALATLTTVLLPVVPQKYQSDAQSNIPVILRQCFSSQIKNANQVAYILATAQHESRFGSKMYSRSESLVEDHNPLQTEHKKVKDKKTGKTTVQDIPYRSNHVTGNRVNADPSNTNDLDTYYDNAYGGRLGNVKGSSDAANYRGRGFVQITGRDNYKRLGKQIQSEGFSYTFDGVTYGTKEHPIDLVANPTHVNLVPELAAKIMVSGMQNDSFSQGGKGLSTYVTDKTTDFVGARGLVNGTDRAADIAKIAENFAKILTANNAWGNLFNAPDASAQGVAKDTKASDPSTQPVQRARATGSTSSQLMIQASREGTSPQTLESTPTPQFAIQNIQRQAQPKVPLISRSPAVQRSRVIGNIEGLQRNAPMFGSIQRFTAGTTIQRQWWNPLDWWKNLTGAARNAANWMGEKFMNGLSWMGENAAKTFVEVFVVAAKPFGEIGKQVLQGLQNIGSGLISVIQDPSRFIRTLIEGSRLGLVNFFNNAPKHITSAIGEFLGGRGLTITFPRAFDAESILMAFVSSLGLGWDSIKAKIAKRLGPNGGQAIAQAEKTVPLIQEFAGGLGKSKTFKDAFMPVVQQQAVEGIKTAAQETMIRSALTLLLRLVPGAGTISTIFETISFFVERFGRVKNLAGNILNAFKAVAAGNPVGVANAIEYSFANSMVIVLGLFAKITKIDGFLNKIRSIIQSVTSKIHKYVDSIVEWAVKGLKPWVNRLGKPNSGKTLKPGSSKPTRTPSLVSSKEGNSRIDATKPKPTNTNPATSNETKKSYLARILNKIRKIKPVKMSGVQHNLYAIVNNSILNLEIHSNPMKLIPALEDAIKEIPNIQRFSLEQRKQAKQILENALKAAKEVRFAVENEKNKILSGVKLNPESEKAALEQAILEKLSEIANQLSHVAIVLKITSLDNFYKEAPEKRYLPVKLPFKNAGEFIRSRLYNDLGWSAVRKEVVEDQKVNLIRTIKGIQSAQNAPAWRLLKDNGFVEPEADIKTYDPDKVIYAVDHKEPLAKRWNQSGYNTDDTTRYNQMSERKNLILVTHKWNSAKGSDGINYYPYVGPDFTSKIADGGIKNATQINGVPFNDASGKPIK